jgi:3-oxoacyl-[acyl-carrier-protein] synthase III
MILPGLGDEDAVVGVVFLDIDTMCASFVFELSLAEKCISSCQRDLMVNMYRSTGNVNKDGSSTVHGRLLLLSIGVL